MGANGDYSWIQAFTNYADSIGASGNHIGGHPWYLAAIGLTQPHLPFRKQITALLDLAHDRTFDHYLRWHVSFSTRGHFGFFGNSRLQGTYAVVDFSACSAGYSFAPPSPPLPPPPPPPPPPDHHSDGDALSSFRTTPLTRGRPTWGHP